MIKFTGSGADGRVFLGLGLSHKNLERLKAGRPIRVKLSEVGLPGPPHEVLIFAGENEEVMGAQLYAHGAIGPTTVIHEGDKP